MLDPNQQAAAHKAFWRAVELVDGQAKAGALVGVSQQAISARLRQGKVCRRDWVERLEAASKVSRFDLRPDLYRPEPDPVSLRDRSRGAIEPAR